MRSVSLWSGAIVLALVIPTGIRAQVDHSHHAAASTVVDCATIDERAGCTTEAYLLTVMRHQGVAAAMAALDSLVAQREDLKSEGHAYAHAIGIAAYTGAEEVGEVFSRCTPAYQSGCYHGVIQSYFLSHIQNHAGGLEAPAVNALCQTQRADLSGRWLLFQCAHGMGHGMMMLTGNHLPAALEGCDLVNDGWERESCYGGAFMENIVHATTPDHSTGRPGEAAAHSHGAAPVTPSADRPPFEPLRRNDPLYPCSVLPEQYLAACYQMQTSVILYFNGSDVRDASAVCARAAEPFRETCFQSLGRDVSSITLQNHDEAIRLCSTAPTQYQPWCHIGYTKNLIDVTADPADGFAYCRLLPAGESKRVCNIAVGEQIWVLHEDVDARIANCAAAEAAYVEACRHGAGLPESPPLTVPSGAGPAR